jgi:hypothetical protein
MSNTIMGMTGLNQSMNNVQISSTDSRSMQFLAERIRESVYANRVQGPVMSSIMRKFEDADFNAGGFLTESMVQSVFESCDIILTPPDLRSIRNKFRRSVVEDKINYRALCDELKVLMEMSRSGGVGSGATQSILQSPALAKKLSGIRSDGIDIRKIFEDQDFDKTGMVNVRYFTEVVMIRYGILQTERQLNSVLSEYANVSNGNQINYRSFCDALSRIGDLRRSVEAEGFGYPSSMNRGLSQSSMTPIPRLGLPRLDVDSSKKYVMGSGYDGMASYKLSASTGDLRGVTGNSTAKKGDDQWDRYDYGSARSSGRATYEQDTITDTRWTCTGCTHQNRITSSRCEVCALKKVDTTATIQCLHCNFPSNPKGTRNCTMCGVKL